MDGAGYSRQWRDLRIRTWLFVGMFLLFIPAMALATSGLGRISPDLGDSLVFWFFGGWAVATIILGFYQISFRCPRCGGVFGSEDLWTNQFARKCLHCGLKRYVAPAE